MSTRSIIGLRNNDGSVTYIYCHHDGYLSYVGELLCRYYKTKKKVKALLALGDMSVLGAEPSADEFGWTRKMELVEGEGFKYNPEQIRTDKGFDKFCITYASRGEEDVDAQTCNTIKEFLNVDRWQEYAYLFHKGKWYCNKYDGNGLNRITIRICQKED